MSRLVKRPVAVLCDAAGRPSLLVLDRDRFPVLAVGGHWREWIGVVDGAPERDIRRVETARGISALHNTRRVPGRPTDEDPEPEGEWIPHAWME